MIAKAATIFRGKMYTGWRHCLIMEDIRADLGILKITHQRMGFVTDDGRFVDREEAGKIAIACGQIDELKYQKRDLFSEEMWDKNGKPLKKSDS